MQATSAIRLPKLPSCIAGRLSFPYLCHLPPINWQAKETPMGTFTCNCTEGLHFSAFQYILSLQERSMSVPNIAVQQKLPQEQTGSIFSRECLLVSNDKWPPKPKEVHVQCARNTHCACVCIIAIGTRSWCTWSYGDWWPAITGLLVYNTCTYTNSLDRRVTSIYIYMHGWIVENVYRYRVTINCPRLHSTTLQIIIVHSEFRI